MAEYVHGCPYVLILNRVCLANTASHTTARPNCLSDTARSCAHSNALLCILSSIKVCHKGIPSVIDHLTRFVILIPIKDKAAHTIVRHLIERVCSVFGPPETLHSDQGNEFENEFVKELQSVFGYKKTRAGAFRPQGNSVLDRVHSTVHNMLAM